MKFLQSSHKCRPGSGLYAPHLTTEQPDQMPTALKQFKLVAIFFNRRDASYKFEYLEVYCLVMSL